MGKTVLMAKEWKIRLPEYYVCDMNRYIHNVENWYLIEKTLFDYVIMKIMLYPSPKYLKVNE